MAEAVQHSQDDIISGDDCVLPVEIDQRTAPRFTLLIRTAKLLTSQGEFLCVLRDASAIGVSVRTFHELPNDRRMLLEMPGGDRHEIAVVWKREGAAGFRFSQPIDTRRMIEGGGRFARRPVRLCLQVPAVLSCHGRTFDAVIHNLSQQGARIECDERLALEQKLRLEADSLPSIHAKVRWRRGKEYGLVFEDTFQFAELAQLARELQRGVDPLVPPADAG